MQANSGQKFCSHFSFWIWKVWKGREKLRKIWMSWKWKEIFRWNKKHFLLFLYTLKIFIWLAAPYMIALCIFTSLESLVRQLFLQVFSSHFNYSKSIQFQTFFRLLDGASKNVIQCIPNWKKIWFSFSCGRILYESLVTNCIGSFFLSTWPIQVYYFIAYVLWFYLGKVIKASLEKNWHFMPKLDR